MDISDPSFNELLVLIEKKRDLEDMQQVIDRIHSFFQEQMDALQTQLQQNSSAETQRSVHRQAAQLYKDYQTAMQICEACLEQYKKQKVEEKEIW